MKTLLIMRHAKSSRDNPTLPDYERPLNKRGWRDAPRMGAHLLQQGLTPDLILSSSAKRARDTAYEVAKACHYDGEPELVDMFYDAYPRVYDQIVEGLPNGYQRVLVIGHNPHLEVFTLIAVGKYRRMPTAAIAHLEFPIERWEEFHEQLGTLVNLWTPKKLFPA